jgi:hypothetical protein
MVNLYDNSCRLAVLSSRSNGGSGVSLRLHRGPGYPTILLFYYSTIPVPIVRQRLVARCRSGNKPNFRRGRGTRGLGDAGRGESCKTKPISGTRPRGPGAIVQNKANSRVGRGRRGVGRGAECATSPRCPASGNKANSAWAGQGRVPDEQEMRNKANSRRGRAGRGHRDVGQMYQTNPIRGSRGSIMQNKPNFRLPRCSTIPV